MGTTSRFTCDDCGYSASVSGGRDFGFMAVVQTTTCQDCRELVDVLIGHHGPTSVAIGLASANEEIGYRNRRVSRRFESNSVSERLLSP